jgi:small-conductance mechanosensitive channel
MRILNFFKDGLLFLWLGLKFLFEGIIGVIILILSVATALFCLVSAPLLAEVTDWSNPVLITINIITVLLLVSVLAQMSKRGF